MPEAGDLCQGPVLAPPAGLRVSSSFSPRQRWSQESVQYTQTVVVRVGWGGEGSFVGVVVGIPALSWTLGNMEEAIGRNLLLRRITQDFIFIGSLRDTSIHSTFRRASIENQLKVEQRSQGL